MRAVSALYGIPAAAVLSVAAGTDLLCLGRDATKDSYLAVRRALSEAVAEMGLPLWVPPGGVHPATYGAARANAHAAAEVLGLAW